MIKKIQLPSITHRFPLKKNTAQTNPPSDRTITKAVAPALLAVAFIPSFFTQNQVVANQPEEKSVVEEKGLDDFARLGIELVEEDTNPLKTKNEVQPRNVLEMPTLKGENMIPAPIYDYDEKIEKLTQISQDVVEAENLFLLIDKLGKKMKTPEEIEHVKKLEKEYCQKSDAIAKTLKHLKIHPEMKNREITLFYRYEQLRHYQRGVLDVVLMIPEVKERNNPIEKAKLNKIYGENAVNIPGSRGEMERSFNGVVQKIKNSYYREIKQPMLDFPTKCSEK